MSAGAPQSPGVAIFVEYYGVDNVTGLPNIQLVCVLNNGLTTWRANVMLAAASLVSSWHNVALSWGPYIGLLLYLDGRVVGILLILYEYIKCGFNRQNQKSLLHLCSIHTVRSDEQRSDCSLSKWHVSTRAALILCDFGRCDGAQRD